jgi:hypothetical protein
MNGIRRLLGWLVVLVFATSSLPAFAAKGGNNGTDKAYSLVMDEQAVYTDELDPPVLPRAVITPVKVQALLKNEAPPASAASNPGSFEVVITNPGVTIFVDPDHQPSGATDGVLNGTAIVVPDANGNNTRIVVTNMAPLKGQKTYVLTFWVTSCGDALWDANVRTGSSLNGDPFTRIKDNIDPSTHLATNLQTLISCGTLACGDTIELVSDRASTTPELVVTRGPYNSDGTCAATSNFYASNKLLTADGQLHFRWPVGPSDQPLAVWMYDVVSTSPNVPQIAWLNSDGSKTSVVFPDPTLTQPQLPAYLDGLTAAQLACVPLPGQPDPFPRPYGALSNNANAGATTIRVDTSNAILATPTPPFDVVVGTERMRVTSISGPNWRVNRSQGGTSAGPHPSGAKVMSTPLPLLPASGFAARVFDGTVGGTLLSPAPSPYTFGHQARVCIVGGPLDNGDGTWSTTLMDLSDPWVRIGQ